MGTPDFAEGSFSTSKFPLPLPENSKARGKRKWEVCRRVMLDPLGHFLGSAPAEHFLRTFFALSSPFLHPSRPFHPPARAGAVKTGPLGPP